MRSHSFESVLHHSEHRLADLSVCGDAWEIGHALGRHAAASLRLSVGQSLEGELGAWRLTRRVAELRTAAQTTFPDAYRELEGLAHGSDLPFNDLFLFNCAPDLPIKGAQARSGCTTFLLPAQRSEHRPAIIAHNEDASLATAAVWFIANISRGGHESFTSLCYGGKLPGTAFSVNGHGLVQTINDVRALECGVGVPRGFLARAVMDCRNSDAAIELIRSTARASGYHHSLASIDDAVVYSVEAPSFGERVVRVEQPLVHANHLIHNPLSQSEQYVVGGSSFRQSFGEELLGHVRADPVHALRTSAKDGRTIAQAPTAENDWHKTIATAIFQLYPGALVWSAFGGEGKQMVSGGIGLPAIDS